MTVKEQIKKHIAAQPERKGSEMESLHKLVLKSSPGIKLWFDDGKNSENKTVANPTIGYGLQTIKYANGSAKDFFQVGISANTTGISVYILGLKDKAYLAKTYGKKIGKATVTGYCIKFRSLDDIDQAVLLNAIQYGIKQTAA